MALAHDDKIEETLQGLPDSYLAIFRIMTEGESPKAIKQALKARFGSLEEPARLAFDLEVARVSGAFDGLHSEFEQKWAEAFDSSIHLLQDLKPWEDLAALDPEAYSKNLDKALAIIKRMMNARVGFCGCPSVAT